MDCKLLGLYHEAVIRVDMEKPKLFHGLGHEHVHAYIEYVKNRCGSTDDEERAIFLTQGLEEYALLWYRGFTNEVKYSWRLLVKALKRRFKMDEKKYKSWMGVQDLIQEDN